ncbi:MAG: hypothetical protein ACRD28_00985 [Acidobacteriaceae bacterium]
MDTLGKAPAQTDVAAPEADFPCETVPRPEGWSPLTRVGFRIAFIYFIGFMWLYGNDGADFNAIVMWRGLSNWLNWPLDELLGWIGPHVVHLKNIHPHWYVTHRGDTLANWVLDQVFIVASLVGGLLWTAIARLRHSTRTEYRTLLAWLRFFLRLSVGFFMIAYGMLKVFPLQMPPISIAILSRPAGELIPHDLLWSTIGLFPLYESICGIVEVIAGGLVLFRRTALIGTLLSIFLMSNVVLYNMFFGVSVKLFAINLMFAAIFLVLPDAKPMLDFFWRRQPATQAGTWTPPLTRRGVRIYVRALEVIFIVASFTINPMFDGAFWHYTLVVARTQSPLLGAWHLDATHPATGPFVTQKGPATELYVDTVERAITRSGDGTLSRTYLTVNAAAHTVWVKPFVGYNVNYHWQMPDPNHLILTSLPPRNAMQSQKGQAGRKAVPPFTPAVMSFTRIPLPAHYRLFESKFHFVSFY